MVTMVRRPALATIAHRYALHIRWHRHRRAPVADHARNAPVDEITPIAKVPDAAVAGRVFVASSEWQRQRGRRWSRGDGDGQGGGGDGNGGGGEGNGGGGEGNDGGGEGTGGGGEGDGGDGKVGDGEGGGGEGLGVG